MSNPNPNESTRFQPWNPWRPVGTRNVETLFRDAIEKMALDGGIEDVEKDLILALLAKAKGWDIKALEMYLDRLYGKPKQSWTLEVTGDGFATMLNKVRETEKE